MAKKRNSGGRALFILLASLMLVIFMVTTISQAGLGAIVTVISSGVGEAVGDAAEAVGSAARQVASRPLAEGIASFVEEGDLLAIPDGDFEKALEREGFFLAYDESLKIALWVGYELTAAEVAGDLPRDDGFRRDPFLGDLTPTGDSYSGSGYDRGHLIPAADVEWSLAAMEASFYMSNIVPQTPALNRGPWRELEEQIRELALDEGAVIIRTGPILGRGDYPRLPEAGTVIPEYFFKVILDIREPDIGAWGFIMPNDPQLLAGHAYSDFLFPVDRVEEFSGFDFFSPLPDELEEQLENRTPALF